jgi:hypothetical protein
MRVIIRFSLDDDTNSYLTNKLRAILTNLGFERQATGTYEAINGRAAQIAAALEQFWQAIATHTGRGTVDHFWMYSDVA